MAGLSFVEEGSSGSTPSGGAFAEEEVEARLLDRSGLRFGGEAIPVSPSAGVDDVRPLELLRLTIDAEASVGVDAMSLERLWLALGGESRVLSLSVRA